MLGKKGQGWNVSLINTREGRQGWTPLRSYLGVGWRDQVLSLSSSLVCEHVEQPWNRRWPLNTCGVNE